MIQRVKKPIKFCWMSSAIVIIVFAVLLQLAKWSLPHINYFNASLESYVSKQVGARVSLEHISAKWTGLRPKVVVDGLSVEANDGLPLLAIKSASMRLDILLSLYHWTPVWHSVEAEGVTLSVSQNEAGGWSVGGMSPTNKGRGWRYRSPSALFLMAGDVRLESANILFTLHNQRQIEADIPLISIQNNGHFHRLNAKAAIGDNSAFNFILEGVGDPSIPDQFFAQAYLKLNRFPVERLSQLFGKVAVSIDDSPLVTEASSSADVAESEANLSLWLDFASPSRFLMNGHVELLNDESSAFAKKYYLDIPVSADISGDYSIEQGLSVSLSNVDIDRVLSIDKARIHLHENKVNAAIDSMDLQSWIRWSEKRLIRSEKVNDVIRQLAPAGQLTNIHSTIDLLSPANSVIMANLAGIQTESWKGLPEFRKVGGYLEAGIDKGFVLLDANDFSFFPDEVYSTPMVSDYASGYVGWKLSHESKTANVYGYDLKMLGDYGEAKGYFSLDIGWQDDKQENSSDTDLTLQIGLKNSNALFHQQLVPKLLPKDLLAWMKGSIKSGDVNQAGFFYRGGLKPDSSRMVQFFADVEGGELDFSSDWPALKNVTGRFVIDDEHISGHIEKASVYKGDNLSGSFDWNKNNQSVLAIKAKGISSAQSGLRYLRESWLSTKVGDVVKQVSGKGLLGIDVDLVVPLNNSTVSADQKVNIVFKDNQLTLNEVGLEFDSIGGQLNYVSATGFSSKNLSANLFGKPVSAVVGNDINDENTLSINGKGSADVSSIFEWLDQPILTFASGNIDYLVDIRIPTEGSEKQASLLVTSDLVGVSTQFPKPFDKKVTQELPFSLEMPFKENTLEYKLTVGQYFSGHFVSNRDDPLIATIALSDVQFPELTSLPEKGIKLVSQFERLDANEWIDFIKQYPQSDNIAPGAIDAFISVDEFIFNDYQLNNMMVSSHREQNGWSLFVDSSDALGGVYIDDDKTRPLVVDIDYLHWPLGYKPLDDNELANDTDELAGSQDVSNVMSDINPRGLPSANIQINRLVYKDKPLGNWSMQLRPDDQGLLVSNIVAAVNGFTLAGAEENQGATLRWVAESDSAPESTQFNGIVFGDNPKALFEQWDLPFGLESEETTLSAGITWLGSPAEFAVEKLQGKVKSQHANGIFTQEKTNDATGILRLFGLFNFDSWARRVRLDFSDVYKKGIVFDELKGELSFDNGIITISQPLTMEGPSSKMSLSGSINYPEETVDAKLVATVPIGGNLTVVAALAGGLPAAAGVYLVSKLFEKQVEKVSSINYLIEGSWSEPLISVEKLEDQSVNQVVEEAAQ